MKNRRCQCALPVRIRTVVSISEKTVGQSTGVASAGEGRSCNCMRLFGPLAGHSGAELPTEPGTPRLLSFGLLGYQQIARDGFPGDARDE